MRVRQFEPQHHVRLGNHWIHARLFGQYALVQASGSKVALPRAWLRSPLRHYRKLRHRNDSHLDERKRSRHGRNRATCRRRRFHQGHMVRASIRQPHRHHVFRRNGSSPCGNALRRERFPHFLGQRVLRASSLRRRARTCRRYRRCVRGGRQPEPLFQIRQHVESHASGRRHRRRCRIGREYRGN